MKHPLPGLDSLKVFEAAARHLSFAKAAEELCITRGAVSYQIRKLESELGTALFKRRVRQVLLTDAGQKMLQTTQQVFNDLKLGIERIEPGQQQTILIAVTTYVASRWLSPRRRRPPSQSCWITRTTRPWAARISSRWAVMPGLPWKPQRRISMP